MASNGSIVDDALTSVGFALHRTEQRAREPSAKLEQDAYERVLTSIVGLNRKGSIEDILTYEQGLAELELERRTNSPEQMGSLNNTLSEVGGALKTVALARTADEYERTMSVTYTSHKSRDKAGLPKDEARQFFRSQLARINNALKVPFDALD